VILKLPKGREAYFLGDTDEEVRKAAGGRELPAVCM